jgi:hypothetical protein
MYAKFSLLITQNQNYQVRVSPISVAFASDFLKIDHLVQKSKQGHEYTDMGHGDQFLWKNLVLLKQTSKSFGTKRAHRETNT